jgi:hypothetical protein
MMLRGPDLSERRSVRVRWRAETTCGIAPRDSADRTTVKSTDVAYDVVVGFFEVMVQAVTARFGSSF